MLLRLQLLFRRFLLAFFRIRLRSRSLRAGTILSARCGNGRGSGRLTRRCRRLLARVNKAAYEISFKHHFDRIIVNDDLQKACQEAETAICEFLGI